MKNSITHADFKYVGTRQRWPASRVGTRQRAHASVTPNAMLSSRNNQFQARSESAAICMRVLYSFPCLHKQTGRVSVWDRVPDNSDDNWIKQHPEARALQKSPLTTKGSADKQHPEARPAPENSKRFSGCRALRIRGRRKRV